MGNSAILWLSALSVAISTGFFFLVLKLQNWHMVRNKAHDGKLWKVSFSFAQYTNGIINEVFHKRKQRFKETQNQTQHVPKN